MVRSTQPLVMQLASLFFKPRSSLVAKDALPTSVLAAYAVFGAVGLLVYHYVADGEFSSIMTMSAVVQCLGVAFLCIQVQSSGTATGVSAVALALDALALCFRLSSTTWLNGYLPADPSGDHVYQLLEGAALLMLLFLLHQVLVVHRRSYQASDDTFCLQPVIFICLVLAAVLHGDMNDSPVFDTLWMAGLFTGVVAVLPQLWLIARTGGRAKALTSHYIAALALSRLLSGTFMWAAREDITCEPWAANFQHAIFAILMAHLLHLILLADFAYYYARAVLRGGGGGDVQLGPETMV